MAKKQCVKGAAICRIGGYAAGCRYNASAAERFRAHQLAAWREATGRVNPGVVTIAVNGVEYADENAARKAVKA